MEGGEGERIIAAASGNEWVRRSVPRDDKADNALGDMCQVRGPAGAKPCAQWSDTSLKTVLHRTTVNAT